MEKAMFRFREWGYAAGMAIVLIFTGTAYAQDWNQNLDKYMGQALLKDNRAEWSGVEPVLPMKCPPFYLRDEFGQIIDPNTEPGVSRPVSTRQTCNVCHNYAQITRGYHFQMGKDQLYRSTREGEIAPLSLSPGLYGGWLPLYQRQLAPKFVDSAAKIDMTSFEWVSACGICHPGGGPSEFDRAFKRYCDVMGSDLGIANTLDGDYYHAQWDKTGVVEADCLICHLEGYDYSTRAQQLKKLNYKWASVAAARFGVVEGTVKDNEVPKVSYNKNLFGTDGKVNLPIQRPTDRSCLFCHEMSSIQKRGTAWHSHYVDDIHTERGIRCIDCHPGDIRHNFAKGTSTGLRLRDDIDGTALSCKQCHEQQKLGAPNYPHPGLPPLHLQKISCQACHITKRSMLATQYVDTLTGKAIELPVDVDTGHGNNRYGAWWGKVSRGSTEAVLLPFSKEDIEAAANHTVGPEDPLRKMFVDKTGRNRLPAEPFTVDTFIQRQNGLENPDARALMLLALNNAAQPEKEFQPACVFRGIAYAMNNDRLIQLKTTLKPSRVGALAEYPVAYAFDKHDGLIYPEIRQLGVFWACLENGEYRPLTLSEMQTAFQFLKDANPVQRVNGTKRPMIVYDDNNDCWPEVNSKEEMEFVAWAIKHAVRQTNPTGVLYVKGIHAYRISIENTKKLDAPPKDNQPYTTWSLNEQEQYETAYKTKIDPIDLPEAFNPTGWSIGHGVEPASQALGANGCSDCHARHTNFFEGSVMSDPFDLNARHVKAAMFALLGYNKRPFPGAPLSATDSLTIRAWREQYLRPFFPWVVVAFTGLLLLHFCLFGTRHPITPYTGNEICRFRLHERISHLMAMLSILFLAITGFCFLLGKHDPLGQTARLWHTCIGFIAIIGTAGIFISWVWYMFPMFGDLRWILHAGGYLGSKNHYPAGKFNAGQKILFWIMMALLAILAATGLFMWQTTTTIDPLRPILYTIHDLAAALCIECILGHIYLAAILTPHSLRSLFGGNVTIQWAREHHPNWRALVKRLKENTRTEHADEPHN